MAGYDSQVDSVRIRLQAGTDVIVDHTILKADVDRLDPKWFEFNGGLGIILPKTGRLWIQISSVADTQADRNQFKCQLWGQWNR